MCVRANRITKHLKWHQIFKWFCVKGRASNQHGEKNYQRFVIHRFVVIMGVCKEKPRWMLTAPHVWVFISRPHWTPIRIYHKQNWALKTRISWEFSTSFQWNESALMLKLTLKCCHSFSIKDFSDKHFYLINVLGRSRAFRTSQFESSSNLESLNELRIDAVVGHIRFAWWKISRLSH